MGDDIDAVVEEIVVDAYGDDEQLWAFRQFFEDETTFPFMPGGRDHGRRGGCRLRR